MVIGYFQRSRHDVSPAVEQSRLSTESTYLTRPIDHIIFSQHYAVVWIVLKLINQRIDLNLAT